jgi:polyisoprenoid-binding protein YceI
MLRVSVLIFYVFILSAKATAQSPILPAESSIMFKIKNAGFTVDGSFSKPEGTILFDVKNLAESSINASVESATIQTGIERRDRHLRGREYFDSPKYPKITMQSKSFRQVSKNRFVGVFDLTIRDVTKQVEVPFTVSKKGMRKTFKGDFQLNRLDYNIGETSMVLSDDVHISIELIVDEKGSSAILN